MINVTQMLAGKICDEPALYCICDDFEDIDSMCNMPLIIKRSLYVRAADAMAPTCRNGCPFLKFLDRMITDESIMLNQMCREE